MAKPIIVKNITASEILLEDIGIVLPPDEEIYLTELFQFTKVVQSSSLINRIELEEVLISYNGSVWLLVEDALKLMNLITE